MLLIQVSLHKEFPAISSCETNMFNKNRSCFSMSETNNTYKWICKYVPTILTISTFVCLATTTMTCYYSLSGEKWLVHRNGEGHGLVLYCWPGESDGDYGEGEERECQLLSKHHRYKNTDLPVWQNCAFVSCVISGILHMSAVLLFVSSMFIKPMTYCTTVLVFIFSCLSGFMMLLAMSIYTNKFFILVIRDGYSWGNSYVLGWLCFIIDVISIAMVFLLLMLERKRISLPVPS